MAQDEVKHIPGIEEPGTYVLNGEQALSYARIRHEAGGDYKRTERMRNVLIAIVNQLKTKSVLELNKLADHILPRIYTNISAKEIMGMIPDSFQYNISDSTGWPYQIQGDMIGGVWYGVPVTLEENVTKLHQELFGQENYQPTEKVKEISRKIIQKTNYR